MKDINWELYGEIKNKMTDSLCLGEVRTLSEDQINEINNSLEQMNVHMNYIKIQFNKAHKKFGQFPEQP